MKRIAIVQDPSKLPECWRPESMSKENLKARVRQWRELQPKCNELRPILSEARRIEEAERSLRKEIGELMEGQLSIVIDGKTLIHSKEERNNGMDYEKAWAEAMKILPNRYRRKLEPLLKSRIVVIHKLASE